jgi:hypothetical protein
MPPLPNILGISDTVKAFTPPLGYEAVHTAGDSWARQGRADADTTRIGVGEWNQIIGLIRAVANAMPGFDPTGRLANDPTLLRDAIIGFTTVKITELAPGILVSQAAAIATALAANPAFVAACVAAVPTNLNASNLVSGTVPTARLNSNLQELAVIDPGDTGKTILTATTLAAFFGVIGAGTAGIGILQSEGADPARKYLGKPGTFAEAQATSYAPIVQDIELRGYAAPGDGPRAYYARVNAQPAHAGFLRTTDRWRADGVLDSVNGGYWELINAVLCPPFFNAYGKGAVEHTQVRACLDAARILGREAEGLGRTYRMDAQQTWTGVTGTLWWRDIEFDFGQCILPTDWRFMRVFGTEPVLISNLTADAPSGQRVLTIGLASEALLNIGDRIILCSNQQFGGIAGSSKTEYFTIVAKSGTGLVEVDGDLLSSYTIATSARIYKEVLDVKLKFNNVKVKGTAALSPGRGMHLQDVEILEWEKVRADNCLDGGIDIYRGTGGVMGLSLFHVRPWNRSREVTAVNHPANQVTVPAHGWQVSSTPIQILVSSTGVLPTGLAANTAYMVTVPDANTIQFVTDFTSNGTGVMSVMLSVRQYGLGLAACHGLRPSRIFGRNMRHVIAQGSLYSFSFAFLLGRFNHCGTVTGESIIASVYDQHEGNSDCTAETVNGSMSSVLSTEEALTLQSPNASVGIINVTGGGGPLVLVQTVGTGDDRPNLIHIGAAKGMQNGPNGYWLVADTSVGVTDQWVNVSVDSIGGVGEGGVDSRPGISPVSIRIGKMSGRLRGAPIGVISNGAKPGILHIANMNIDRTPGWPWDYNFYDQGSGGNHEIRVDSGEVRDAAGTTGFRINNRSLGGRISLGAGVKFTGGAFFKSGMAGGGEVYRDSQAVATA